MTEQEPEKKVLFTIDEKFRFSCNSGLPCFNTCCRDINIFLTPYDVLRMRRGTWLPSEEFLKRYTVALLGDEGIPLVVLRMQEDSKKTCPFVKAEGCSIYNDRPWSCRMYPVFPVSSEEVEFLIEEKSSCHGFGQKDESTIREWKRDQDIDIYDKMNQAYKEITYHDFFQNGNKLEPVKARMIYTSCYDLDSFKRFLFDTKFFNIYDVDEETINKIKESDEELLNFGYRWLRFSLFSEDTLRLRDKEMDQLLKSKSKEPS